MKLSVAMCTYNGATYLAAQLASLVAQTRPPDELIVCDDCSTDATAARLAEFAATAPFPVRVHVNERNLGSTRNFARAISLCTGDVIALCDQDDVWRADKLARTMATFAATPDAGLVFTNADVVDENLQPLGRRLWDYVHFTPERRAQFRRGRAFVLLFEHTFVTGTTLAFRAELRDLVLPIPTDIAIIHDAWIACLIAATAEVLALDEPLVAYRLHSGQQVGVPHDTTDPDGAFDKLRAGVNRHAPYDIILYKLRAIQARLHARAGQYQYGPEVQPVLDAILTHLQTRASLPAGRLQRVPYVFRELVTLRYHTFSKGLTSVAKDLLC